MTPTIYHNPKCGTSRNTLAMLEKAGLEPAVVEYLKTPLDRSQLASLIAILDIPVRELLRRKGTPYDELSLDDPKWTDDQLIDFIVEHPILMNRPVVVADGKAKLCRPSEVVFELLPDAQIGEFTKEDGEIVAAKNTKD
ncbi:MAG: arsenate reductase (glutaredoxin) [Alphaproteobacteria bacterium]|nr:arsenate reductase (glutaredoxin) [Alphaproteobacteria bacterium]